MAVDDDYVTVQKSQFDCLRQHCEHCPYFGAVIPHGRPSGEPSKKRKTPHELRPQEVSQPLHLSQQLESQLPSHLSQQPEPQLPSQLSQQPGPPLPSQQPQEPGSQLPSESSNGSKSKKPKRTYKNGLQKRSQQKSRKNKAADWFLHNAPKAIEWRKRQTELGLNTVQQYEQAIRAFTAHANIIFQRKPYQGDGHAEHELVDLAERFALLTRDSLTNAKLQKSFARFQALILLSYCEVLRTRGIPQETLDPIIQHIGGREIDRRRLLDSALWINGVIVALVSRGWTIYRATELFFIAMFSKLFTCEVGLILVSDTLSITYLTHIHNNENSQLILEHLKIDEFVKHDYNDCLRPEYTIPGLIASLLDACTLTAHKISLDEICAALGYNSDWVPKSVESIYKVHATSTSTPVASLDLDFEVLGPSSFQSNDGPLTSASSSYPTIRASERRRLRSQENVCRSVIVSPEKSIPPLLYALGGHVPKFMLERAVSQQRRNPLNIIYETTPPNAGLHTHLRDLLSDGRTLWQAVERLVVLSVIGMGESDGMEIYVCGWEAAQFLYVQNKPYWIHQAFELFCYAVSHHQTEDSLRGPEEKKLLAIMEHLLREYSETGLEMPSGDDVVETLLAASRFGTLGEKEHLLSMAAKSMRDAENVYLQAEIVHRHSVLLRLKGDICGSKRRIQEFLNRISPEPNLRSLLHLSQAANYAYDFDFCQAHKEAQKWKPPLNHTQRDLDVVWDQVYFAGRTLKGQGYFNEAKQCFERCLTTDGLRESKRILIKSNLADLYSELDYLQRKGSNSTNSEQRAAPKISFLDKAEEMILPEIELMKARGQHSKGFRRLFLALIEVEIRRCRFDNAEALITEVLDIYSKLNEPDIVDRLGHVRALIAWARISPLSEAEGRWSDVLNWNRKYNPHEEEVFTCALVYLFICSTRFQLGNFIGGRTVLNHAMEVVNGKMPQFLIPGAGTYLFDSVRLQIKSAADWVLPGFVEFGWPL